MSRFDNLWEKTLTYLEEDLPMFQFNVWIKELRPLKEENDMYYFEVSSTMHKNLMEEKYAERIKSTMKTAYYELYDMPDAEIDLHFHVSEDTPPVEEPSLPLVPDDTQTPISLNFGETTYRGGNLNPNYTFDSFVVGKSNEFANAAAKSVASRPGQAYNPLFLYGGVGLGKTHLMHAIGNYILQHNPAADIMYVTSETFTNELIRMIGLTNKNANIDIREQFRNKYRKVDVLMIDDIQFIAGKDAVQDEFFHTFNALHELNKQIVISSDRPPMEMEKLEERIRSRFEGGLLADIKAPDYETRVAILLKKAQMLVAPDMLPIKDEVFHYIAQQHGSNIRTLEGALQRVIMNAELYKDELRIKEVDEKLAREWLKGTTPPPPPPLTPERIVDVVCQYYNVSMQDIRSGKKNREVSFPRQVSMYILREITSFPYKRIAEFFGKKDHTTIMYAEEKIKDQMKSDDELKKAVEDIIVKIKG